LIFFQKQGEYYLAPERKNNSRSIVKLIFKGKAAYYAHKHWRETIEGRFKNYFMALSEEKVDFFLDFIDKAEKFIKRAME